MLMVDGGSVWVSSCCSSLCLSALLVWMLLSSCRRRLRTSLSNSFRSTSEDSEPPCSSSRYTHTHTHHIYKYCKPFLVCARMGVCVRCVPVWVCTEFLICSCTWSSTCTDCRSCWVSANCCFWRFCSHCNLQTHTIVLHTVPNTHRRYLTEMPVSVAHGRPFSGTQDL